VVTTDAVLSKDYAIGMGNIIGSNIANIGLILGILALSRPLTCCRIPSGKFLMRNGLFVVGATFLFAIFAIRGSFDVYTGVVFLIAFLAFLYFTRKSGNPEVIPLDHPLRNPLLITLAGISAVIIGAHLLVLGAVEIASQLGVPPFIIGLSIVAIGTSLPELATSLTASARNSTGIAIGNIFGSNVFNLLFIGGINALYTTIPFDNPLSIMVLLAFTFGMFPLFTGRAAITRFWGTVLLVSYGVSVIVLFII
jgi:cation:H+ antiporter